MAETKDNRLLPLFALSCFPRFVVARKVRIWRARHRSRPEPDQRDSDYLEKRIVHPVQHIQSSLRTRPVSDPGYFSTLPPEITEHIVDFLQRDHQALSALSLTCHFLLPLARQHFFSVSLIRVNTERSYTLLKILRSPLCQITTLDSVILEEGYHTVQQHSINLVLSELIAREVTVRSLTLFAVNIPPMPSAAFAQKVVNLSISFQTFLAPNHAVELAKFISSFANIRLLYVHMRRLDHAPWTPEQHDLYPLPVHLENITFNSSERMCSQFIQWILFHNPPVKSFKLSLPRLREEIFSAVCKYLFEGNGRMIEHLGWTIDVDPSPLNLGTELRKFCKFCPDDEPLSKCHFLIEKFAHVHSSAFPNLKSLAVDAPNVYPNQAPSSPAVSHARALFEALVACAPSLKKVVLSFSYRDTCSTFERVLQELGFTEHDPIGETGMRVYKSQ